MCPIAGSEVDPSAKAAAAGRVGMVEMALSVVMVAAVLFVDRSVASNSGTFSA
jgi:hypothetical protein